MFEKQAGEQLNGHEGVEQLESERVSGGTGGTDPACRSVEGTVGSDHEVGSAAVDTGVPDQASRSVGGAVGSDHEVGSAAVDTGVPDQASRSVEGAVGSGDEVGSAAVDAGLGKLGAAVWADICIPVVQPHGWPVYQLRMGLGQLERLRRETEAAMALLVGAMPESRDTVADIARNSGVSNREARRRKAVADVCGKIKGALEKLKSGAISNEHVSALAPVADIPGAASLLDDAESKSPEELTRDVEEFRLSSACGMTWPNGNGLAGTCGSSPVPRARLASTDYCPQSREPS